MGDQMNNIVFGPVQIGELEALRTENERLKGEVESLKALCAVDQSHGTLPPTPQATAGGSEGCA